MDVETKVLSVTVRDDGVAVLTYAVPGAALNTTRPSFAGELERALTRISEDVRVKAAVLVSGEVESFIAGAGVERLARVHTAAEGEALCREGQAAVAKIAGSPKPIVAAIHGPALGGGFEVALACRGRVLSDDRTTALGLPEVQLGLLPGMNGLQRLAAIAGLRAAIEYGLSGKGLRPATAKKMGVADEVVPQVILVDVAARLALSLAEEDQGPRGKRGAQVVGRLLGRLGVKLGGLRIPRENGPPKLAGVPIGRSLFLRRARGAMLARTGGHYPAPKKILEVLEAFAKRGFEASKDVEARAFGELVVSSVARNLMALHFATTALKKDPGTSAPGAAPGAVERMSLLEVIRTPQTADEVVATAVAAGKRQDKTVIVVDDGVELYTDRILWPFLHEAAWLVTEGAPIDVIDRALVAWGWPVGPLALLDEVGIDVAAHVGARLREAIGARMATPPAVARLAAGGRWGRKNNKGFYLHGEGAKKGKGRQVDISVYSFLGLPVPAKGKRPSIPVEEIQLRCSLQLVNEALRCLGEGVLRSARDGDVGAVAGLGFPPFRGGPFRYVDSLGAPEALRRVEQYRTRLGERWAPAPLLVEMARRNERFEVRPSGAAGGVEHMVDARSSGGQK